MSLSNSDDKRMGTIFMGPSSASEQALDKAIYAQERELWNKRTEREYLDRVKAKAELRGKTIINDAQQRSQTIKKLAAEWAEKLKIKTEYLYSQAQEELEKAKSSKSQADTAFANGYDDGYKAGLEKVDAEIAAEKQRLAAITGSMLKSLVNECHNVFETWREDLTNLTVQAIETSNNYLLDTEKKELFSNLLTQAVLQLEDRRRIIVSVSEHEHELVKELFEGFDASLGVSGFEVILDNSLKQGGLIVESASGKIDNSLSLYRTVVEESLNRLKLAANQEQEDASKHNLIKEFESLELPEMHELSEPVETEIPSAPEIEFESTKSAEQLLAEELFAEVQGRANSMQAPIQFEDVQKKEEPVQAEPVQAEPAQRVDALAQGAQNIEPVAPQEEQVSDSFESVSASEDISQSEIDNIEPQAHDLQQAPKASQGKVFGDTLTVPPPQAPIQDDSAQRAAALEKLLREAQDAADPENPENLPATNIQN